MWDKTFSNVRSMWGRICWKNKEKLIKWPLEDVTAIKLRLIQNIPAGNWPPRVNQQPRMKLFFGKINETVCLFFFSNERSFRSSTIWRMSVTLQPGRALAGRILLRELPACLMLSCRSKRTWNGNAWQNNCGEILGSALLKLSCFKIRSFSIYLYRWIERRPWRHLKTDFPAFPSCSFLGWEIHWIVKESCCYWKLCFLTDKIIVFNLCSLSCDEWRSFTSTSTLCNFLATAWQSIKKKKQMNRRHAKDPIRAKRQWRHNRIQSPRAT